MSEIVFVHGIANEQMTADSLEAAWRLQLSGGIRIAGDTELADRIRDSFRPDAIQCRMAFYGHLFLRPGAQGGASAHELEQNDIANALAAAWIENIAARSTNPDDADDARRAVGANNPHDRAVQGKGAVAGWAIRKVSKIPWFAKPVFGLAKFGERALHQISRYLEDPAIRVEARDCILRVITPETRVVIAHSLGSVVAWEALHQRTDRNELPLFITIGSPLGLKGIIYPNLWPQPPSFPPKVGRWINIADKEDFVAAEADLSSLFPGQEIEGTWTPDNGADPHEAKFYLGKAMLGETVISAFRAPRKQL